jgi:hypothetical protein
VKAPILGAMALLGGLVVASPALAQDAPPAPPPQGSVMVVVQTPPAADLPPPAVTPPPAYPYPPPAYPYPPPAYPYPPAVYPYPVPPQELPPPEGEPRTERGFSAKLYAGPSYQRIFSSSIAGAELGAFLGGVRGTSGWYGGADAFLGKMEGLLFTWVLRPGATWEARLGRAHVGLGLNVNLIGVQRATTSDYIISGGVGGSAFFTVDLVKGDGGALFLGAKMRADFVQGSGDGNSAPCLWGPSAAIGWRSF